MMLLTMILVVYWVFCNMYVAYTMSADEMYNDFVIEQNKIGRFFANKFFCLAWLIKKI